MFSKKPDSVERPPASSMVAGSAFSVFGPDISINGDVAASAFAFRVFRDVARAGQSALNTLVFRVRHLHSETAPAGLEAPPDQA